jgi:formylglycine-generating enzyme required for sulfatase activity
MVGNVFEWNEDCWHKNYIGAPMDGSAWIGGGDCKWRVVRGGSFHYPPNAGLRSKGRISGSSDVRGNTLGFRVARTLLTN